LSKRRVRRAAHASEDNRIRTGKCLGLFAIGVLLLVLSSVVIIMTTFFCKLTSQAIFNAPIPWLKSLDGIACMLVCITSSWLLRQAKMYFWYFGEYLTFTFFYLHDTWQLASCYCFFNSDRIQHNDIEDLKCLRYNCLSTRLVKRNTLDW